MTMIDAINHPVIQAFWPWIVFVGAVLIAATVAETFVGKGR